MIKRGSRHHLLHKSSTKVYSHQSTLLPSTKMHSLYICMLDGTKEYPSTLAFICTQLKNFSTEIKQKHIHDPCYISIIWCQNHAKELITLCYEKIILLFLYPSSNFLQKILQQKDAKMPGVK